MSYIENTQNIDVSSITVSNTLPKATFDYPLRRFTDRVKERAQTPFATKYTATDKAAGNVDALMAMFGRIGFGYLLLDDAMRVTKWNEAARHALEVTATVGDQTKAVAAAFRQLVAPVACKFATGTVSWVVIPYKGGRPIIVHDEALAGSNGVSIVMLLSRESASRPNPARLQQMFGLTCAEVQLAVSLASGQTPLEIARRNKVSRTTIRSHLAALFSKTETNRQSELVALLNHISILP
jgi:DNA-binding CsgD family transcriptional regulator